MRDPAAGPPSLPGRFAAAVFDLDGLLVDTEPLWVKAETALLEAHGGAYQPADAEATRGRSIDDSVRAYAERLGLATAQQALRVELVDRARTAFQTGTTAMPGAVELVHRLGAWFPLAVASNSDRHLVEMALERIALRDCFAAVVTAQDVERPKPAPEVYVEACRQLGVEPHDAIAFEDSSAGVEAAAAAGLTVVGVHGHADGSESAGSLASLGHADVTVESLTVVLDWITAPDRR